MNWIDALVGTRYDPAGEGPTAFNCWNLVRRGLLLGHGIEVPEMPEASPGWVTLRTQAMMRPKWAIVASTQAGDLLAMVGGREPHVGLLLDRTRVLHTCADAGQALIQRKQDLALMGFSRFQVWRYVA